MSILGTSLLGNGLTIRNTRLTEDNVQLLIVLQAPLQCTQVELALTMHDHLAQLLTLLHYPCRILLAHLQESSHQFLCILSIDSLYGTGVLGVRILDEVETPLCILAIQRIASLHVLQLHGTTNITRLEFVDRNTSGSRTSIQLSDTLLASTVSIGQVITRLHRTTHYLKVAYLTDMWLHTCLEEVNAFRTSSIRSNLLTTGIVQLWHLADERHHIAQEFHQAAHTHIFSCTNAEHGEDAAGYQSLTDALAQLVFGKTLALEKFLHQALIILGSSLNESLVQLHGLVHLLFRNLLNDRSTTFWLPGIFLHQ